MRRACHLALLLLACVSAARGEDEEPLDTDRPDFSESSQVVGRDHWQLEAGLTTDRFHANGVTRRATIAPTLLRIGMTATTELRIETDGFTRVHTTDAAGRDERQAGFSDTALGIKWHALDNEGWQPSLAWLLHVEMPSGTDDFRGTGFRPSLRTVAEWELPDGWSVGAMPGVFVDSDEAGRRYAATLLALTLGKAFTPQWHGFLEFAGQQFAPARDGGNVVTLDTGIAWIVTPDVQLDLDAAHGLSAAAPRSELGIGVSVRF